MFVSGVAVGLGCLGVGWFICCVGGSCSFQRGRLEVWTLLVGFPVALVVRFGPCVVPFVVLFAVLV